MQFGSRLIDSEKMIPGQKLKEIDRNNEQLITCAFKTTPYVKFKLVEKAKAQGITLSETISNIVSFYNDNEDLREKFDKKFQRFLEVISDGNTEKIYKYIQQWNKI
jgi:hypothetical protein